MVQSSSAVPSRSHGSAFGGDEEASARGSAPLDPMRSAVVDPGVEEAIEAA